MSQSIIARGRRRATMPSAYRRMAQMMVIGQSREPTYRVMVLIAFTGEDCSRRIAASSLSHFHAIMRRHDVDNRSSPPHRPVSIITGISESAGRGAAGGRAPRFRPCRIVNGIRSARPRSRRDQQCRVHHGFHRFCHFFTRSDLPIASTGRFISLWRPAIYMSNQASEIMTSICRFDALPAPSAVSRK